ncbi:MAG: ATP-binding protein [Deinococcota bacterium]|nr:ATP-binding protein [Deinococcota bacterium]
MDLYVFNRLGESSWVGPLGALEAALARTDRPAAREAYAGLYRALLEQEAISLADAVLDDLLMTETPLSRLAMRGVHLPEGLRAGALLDLERLADLLERDWQAEASRLLGSPLPPLEALGHRPAAAALAGLGGGDPEEALRLLVAHYRRHGAGPLARSLAFRWAGGRLAGVAHPVRTELDRLVGLERQLAGLTENTETFLNGRPAHHVLLYGPRGSGKSSAVRALLPRYAEEGLRLVELHPQDLGDILTVMERLRGRPHRYLLFVDDLAFEAGDRGYGPLKTLLEGSLSERPENVLMCATSNRRHLVRERFSDRPDPLDDDVHGWDTVNERLALADRFGLTLTFPGASQTRYLDIVRGLAAQGGLSGDDLEERALRFAQWGNGLSGRTAQQFVDTLRAEPPLPQSGK